VNSNKVCNDFALSPCNLYSLPNLIRVIKSKELSCSGLRTHGKGEKGDLDVVKRTILK
jgi:hypothetical protein